MILSQSEYSSCQWISVTNADNIFGSNVVKRISSKTPSLSDILLNPILGCSPIKRTFLVKAVRMVISLSISSSTINFDMRLWALRTSPRLSSMVLPLNIVSLQEMFGLIIETSIKPDATRYLFLRKSTNRRAATAARSLHPLPSPSPRQISSKSLRKFAINSNRFTSPHFYPSLGRRILHIIPVRIPSSIGISFGGVL